LTLGFGRLGENVENNGDTLDPEVSAAFAEEIAKVTDSLSKVNQQLVELVKIDAKKTLEMEKKPSGAAKNKAMDEIYDELASSDEKEFN
jgi:uncharacterized protein YoxC